MKASPFTILLVLLGAFSPQVFFGQKQLPAPADNISARQMLAEAKLLLDSAQFPAAETRAENACRFFQSSSPVPSPDLAEALYWRGKIALAQEKYAPAQAFFSEASAAWAALYPQGSVEEARARVELGVSLMRLEDAEGSMEQGKQAIALLDRLGIDNCPERFRAMRVIGRSLYGTGLYNKAIPYYEEALKLAQQYFGEENTESAWMMIYLGNCLNYCGLQERAIAVLERGLAIQQTKLPPVHEEIAGTYMALGACHQSLRKFDNALAYYDKALEIRLQLNSPRLAYGYSMIGQTCLEKQDYGKALDYFQKQREVLIQHKLENDPAYAYCCRDFGLAYRGLKDYERAIHWLNQALLMFQGSDSSDTKGKGMGLDQCNVILHIGRAQSASGDFDAALQSFEKSKAILAQLFDSDYILFYELNAEIASTYTQLHLKTGEETFLEKSRAHFRLAEKGVAQHLQNETYQGSERKLLYEALPYFERAIHSELLYATAHPDDKAVLEHTWRLSETMHGYLLLSATQESHARHFAGISDQELHRDSSLRANITKLEQKKQALLQQKGLSLTDSTVVAISNQIAERKEELARLIAFFEKEYPDYFRLKYDLGTSTLAQTQRRLSPRQTLLEYFTGDSSIFVFVVKPESAQVFEWKRDFPLAEWGRAFREGISGYHSAAQKTPEGYKNTVLQYTDAAQQLYEKLLAPIAEQLSPELIVVPSEIIAELPFEALLSAAPKDLGNFKTYPFLLRQHDIQYAYSATMLHQMTDLQWREKSGGLLAFAPFYDADTSSLAQRTVREAALRYGLSPLPYSGEEVFRAKKIFGQNAEAWVGKAATKQKFLQLAPQFKILHLATHGKANQEAGDFSFLAFSAGDGAVENGLISVGELYNLSLNAELVVLSACETGIGERQRGEGVVSLARAFAYAGTKSVIASLWSVNDRSTMLVMDNFYTEIKEGKAKNHALAEAKRQYLSSNPGRESHPFFWAGFVGVGDMGGIKN